ncbi:hypothetical protein O3M35_001749 [Rhynocoris fuscipes]|uniref:Uncharacterized protein n=1 Tax=Rhynocoris fuscipes TaxID=488301 RepID=A0AAW1CPI4_9HEMI
MVKDIPIPEGIFTEFKPFIQDKENLAKLFDNLDCCVLCDEKRKEKDMPSQTKGQNCLDRYFVKINSQKNSSTCESEMGKKSTNNNSIHNVSSSSDSEKNENNLKIVNTKNHMAIELDANSDEAFQIEPTPSKPIIAAMNALGKLKQDIAKVNIDDNSSRDSTALVIDEEQLEPEKDSSPDIEETPQIKSRKSNDAIQSSKSSKDKITSSNNKPTLANESLNFSNFFNSSFSTSTPVDESGKRKRTDDDESSDQPSSKKPKEKNVKFDKETWLESMRENMNLENLVGKNLKLNGETRFKFEVNGTNQLYECFAEKDTMGRHVNMILPSRKEEKLKFGVYQLNGSVLISEGFGDLDENSSSDQEEMKVNVDSIKDKQSKKLSKNSLFFFTIFN